MSTVTTKITEAQEKALEAVTKTQEPMIDTVKKIIDAVEGRVPELKVSLGDNLPDLTSFVDAQYAFAGKVLDNQQKFILAIIEALKPVTEKVIEAKPKAKVVKKATAAAA